MVAVSARRAEAQVFVEVIAHVAGSSSFRQIAPRSLQVGLWSSSPALIEERDNADTDTLTAFNETKGRRVGEQGRRKDLGLGIQGRFRDF